ncbi:hypothetical protein D3C84_530240 [compost metagenome]
MTRHVLPELTHAELAADHNGGTGAQRGRRHGRGRCAVVQRQTAIEHIPGSGLQGRFHHIARRHPAHVAVTRRLGQACGARGKDQQGRRLRVDVRADIPGERRARGFLQARIEMPVDSLGQRCGPGIFRVSQQPARQVWKTFGGLHIGQALFTDHQRLGLGSLQRMQQRSATDLSVDEGHHHTELDQTEPGAEKRRTIFHGQGADITGAQAIGIKGVGHLVGPRIDLEVAQGLLAIDQKRLLSLLACLLFQTIGQGVKVARLDLPGGRRALVEQRLGLLPWHWTCWQDAAQVVEVHCATSWAIAW